MAQQIDIVANLLMKVDGAEAGINKLKNSLSKLKIPDGLDNSFKKSFANLDVLFARYRSQVEKGFSTKADVANFAKTGKALDAELDRISKHFTELTGKQVDFKVNSAEIIKTEQELEKLIAQRNELAKSSVKFEITGAKEGYKDIESLLTKLKEVAGNTKTGQYASGALDFLKQGDLQSALVLLEKASVSCKRLSQEKKDLFAPTGLDMSTAIKKIVEELTGAEGKFGNVNTEVAKFEQILADLRTGQIKDAGDLAQRLADDMLNAGSAAKQANGAMQDFAQSSFSMSQQLSQLQQSTQYFFGLRNMINLLKRGLKEAISTIKELDAAMTETAVVTKFDVSDMWAKLPEYTANANALGATVKDMYEATTLYYQQGLDTAAAMGIANETMKMARIGGLEAADATDKMTAALRGFNMEINETSAQRVNDVYSNLAAKTASNTEELGTAMQRTASIAASAGMSFEGTAAFLAQAIETTREPAENLGTAMKTIVARFTELKKNPLEIAEVDGEEVSYNKVDTALQSIGVSLKDANGQFRALDEVFLDISQRWNSLTQTQQRYVATTAAGSRQQSRFIAMMSNYDRTMQLMEYANNSAGASQEQFGKTLDSLEAKLNKFQNAWKKFLMSIMNDSWTKGVVTGATKILDIVNKITDLLSGGGRLKGVKSMLSLFTAFTALKFAGRGINGLIGGLGGMLDPRVGFRGGFSNGALGAQAAKISNPIVQAIHGLIPHIDKAATDNLQYKGYGNFKEAKRELNNQFNPLSIQTKGGLIGLNTGAGKYSLSGVQDIFSKNGINEAQQKALFASFPGLKKNMTSALATLMKESSEKPEVTKGLMTGFRRGTLTSEEVLRGSGLLTNFNKAVQSRAEEGGEEAARAFIRAERKTISKEETQAIVAQGKAEGRTGKDLQGYVTSKLDERLNTRGAVYTKNQKVQDAFDAERELSTSQKLANTLGQVGGALTSAGMSLQMFGSQLSMTNPILGEMVTRLGGLLSAAGAIPNMLTSIIAGGAPVIALTLAVTALGTAWMVLSNKQKKIKEDAEAISKAFEDTNKQTQDNIATLKGYQSELATLSKGVDINGNNVNLSDSDYARYLEIVDKIAEVNPEIVKGYNAQGHAIIDNNKALNETLATLKETQEKAAKTYTESDSLQKLIDARNIDKTYKKETSTLSGGQTYYVQGEKTTSGGRKVSTTPMAAATSKVAAELEKADWFDEKALKKYGIESLDALKEGREDAVRNYLKYEDQIQSELQTQAAKNHAEFSKSLTKSFEDFAVEKSAFDEAIQPVYENLATYATNLPSFESIGEEFKSSIMAGLKDIAIQPDLNAKDMQEQARVLVQEFDNLTAEGSDYATAMAEVEEAQDSFAESLDASEYTSKTENALQTLNNLMEQYAGKTDVYSQAIAEYLQNQIDRIKNFTEEGSVSLTSALNEVSSSISAAEGAYDSFKESTKTDFSTGADSMKSIYDEVTKETDGVALHMEGRGDNTFWTGARALLGDDFVEKNGDNINKVKEQIKSLEPMLQEGEAGYKAFHKELMKVDPKEAGFDKWLDINAEDGSWKIDTDIEPDGYKKLAEYLGMSEEFLVSMLNKGRQFQGMDFNNIKDVRTALAADNAAITSGSNIFVKTDYLNNALSEAGYVNPADQKRQRDHLADNGIIEIKDPDKITKKDFDSMGIRDLPGLIKSFGDTGQYNRDEIQQYAEALGKSGLIDYRTEDFAAGFDQYLKEQEHPELEPVQSIESTVDRIAGLLEKDRILSGKVTEEDEQNAKDFHHSIYGNKGVDTQVQHFGRGENEQGNVLSAKQYKQTYDDLEKAKQEAEKWASIYEQGAENAKGKEKKRLQDIADSYKADAEYIAQKQKVGEEEWKQKYAQQKYKEAYQEGKEKGLTPSDVISNAQAAKQKAYETADEIIQAVKDGSTEALENIDTTDVKEKSKNTTKKKNEAEDEGKKEANDEADTSSAKESGKESSKKKNKAEDEGKKEEANNVDTSAAEEAGETSIEKTNSSVEHGIERAEAQDAKTNSTGESAGEEAYNKRSASIDHGIQQAEQHDNKTNSPSPAPAPTSTPKPLPQGVYKAEEHDAKVKVDADINEGALEQAKTEIVEIKTLAEEGATFAIDVTGIQQLTRASNAAEKLNSSSGEKTINVSAGSLNTSQLNQDIKNINKLSAKIKVGADTKNALTQAENARKSIDRKTATIDVKVKKTGINAITVDGHTWNITTRAKGQNNHGYFAPPILGSAARGGYGQLGPKGKGGLTLTGELGYEVAWLPSENRSMILGANGPQMVDLPGDAVVWNHEQSKKILKSHPGIPAGSMGSGDPYGGDTGSSGGGSTGSYRKRQQQKSNKSTSKAVKEVEKLIQKGGKVLVWWENAAHRMDKAQHNAEISQKKLSQLLKQFGVTGEQYRKLGKDYEKYLDQQFDVANQKKARADAELNMTNNGVNATLKYLGKKTKTAEEQAAQKTAKKKLDDAKNQLKKAKKTKSKKDDKKAQKAVDKAQAAYDKTAGAKKDKTAYAYMSAIGARREISYEQTTKKKDKKGKWKTTTKTKKETINLAGYITQDSETGAYQIDQAAISAVAKTNKAKAEAIKQAAEQQLNDLISKQQAAEKEAIEAAEALDDFYNETYETFGAWEKTITEAYLLAQDLERLSSLRSVFQNVEDLEFAKLEAGFSDVSKSLPIVNQALQQNKDLLLQQVQASAALAQAKYDEYQASLSYEKQLANSALYQGTAAAADADAIRTALGFLESVNQSENFDYEAAVTALNAREWQQKDYDKIKDGLDKIAEKQTAYYDALAQSYQTMTEVYQLIEEYQSYMADFENSLISGIEEQTNKEIDKLSKLNSALSDAAKDLIDEVKRKLDERRKQEDNAKTEQDISQKQQRLAALRADTSGGHQVEIAQLEKEIAEAQQNYNRTLEDQLLDRLSAQQDDAAKQRERQINLLEAQRDLAAALGTNVAEVNEWLKDPDKYKEQIRSAWLANQNYDDKGENEQKQLREQFEKAWTQYLAYAGNIDLLEEIVKQNELPEGEQSPILSPVEQINQKMDILLDKLSEAQNLSKTFTIADLEQDEYGKARSASQVRQILEANGQAVTAKEFEQSNYGLEGTTSAFSAAEMRAEGYKIEDIKDSYTTQELKEGGYTAQEFGAGNFDYQTAREVFGATELTQVDEYKTEANKELQNNYSNALAALRKKGSKFTYNDVKTVADAAKVIGKNARTFLPAIVAGKGSPTWVELLKVLKDKYSKYRLARTFTDSTFKSAYDKVYGKGAYKKNREFALKNKTNRNKYPVYAYESGGLANYTGPAWLDGTPSKPELVLSATDTKNFLALRDVLGSAMKSAGSVNNSYGGDATYEININVDHLSSDYDVDKVAERVKKIIVKDSSYRNVTQVRNFR